MFRYKNYIGLSISCRFEINDGIRREEHREISDPESDNTVSSAVWYIPDNQGCGPETNMSIGEDCVIIDNRVDVSVITTLQGP